MGTYEPDDLSKSVAYGLVGVERRRTVISVLLAGSSEWDLDALARRVAARENGVGDADVADETHRIVAISLRHHHLPKLDSGGVVDVDYERNSVAPTDSLDDLGPLV